MAATDGVETTTEFMRTKANEAAHSADLLIAAIRKLDGQMRAILSTWKGAAPAAFWIGHEEHVATVTQKLGGSLHTMGQAITTSSVNYDTADDTSRGEHAAVTAQQSGIPMHILTPTGA